MKVTGALVAVTLALLLGTTSLMARQQTGLITGRVVDTSGAVLPGVTITVAGPTLLEPRVVISSANGTYRVPELPIGTYSVTFELPGFRSVVQNDIRITIGFNAQVNGELSVSAVEETVTVTGESPIIDTKETGTASTFSLEELQNIPTSRDPWAMIDRAPAIAMDRVNVGGSESGQQSNYISRGASGTNNKWSIDGVDITDMSATGASPGYYDFDMLEQMQVRTGGADVRQQTGGVGINLVTRSGTDTFKGSGRTYVTDDNFESDNIDDALREAGAGSGAPIQNIKDYGFEVGGPIKQGRAWYWGSYGVQDIRKGVVGFYKDTPTCKPTPPTDTQGLRDCLETDLTTLKNYNWKLQWMLFQGNKMTVQNSFAEKVRGARGASDTRPIETTQRQQAVASSFGKSAWTTGPNPMWKASDQYVVSDRWLVDAQWAHYGNNFMLGFQDDSLRDVQARYEVTTGAYSRSFQESIFIRPTNSFDLTTNYFLPATLGGDHAFVAGVRWRTAHSTSLNHRGGNAYARFRNGVPDSVALYRDGDTRSHLDTWAYYAQDTYTVNRFTFNVGFRVDVQDDYLVASSVAANPLAPEILPAIDFQGANAGVKWTDFSPRFGVTYDLTGEGRTIVTGSYATYYGQRGPGDLSGELAAVGAVNVRYGWNDLNGDEFVQRDEIDFSEILSRSSSYDPENPTNTASPGAVDPDLQNDRTREFIIGFDHQLMPNVGVGASYIWRKYDRFNFEDSVGLSSADYVPVSYQPECQVSGALCNEITYFEPTIPIPSEYVIRNAEGRFRDYNGVELTLTKRYSNRWSGNLSYAYNDAVDHWDSPNGYEDPTCTVGRCIPSSIYAPESGGSGIDNIYTNAKWLVKAQGSYTMPWQEIGISGAFSSRQGYPFPQYVLTPNRANQAGTAEVLLLPLGDTRLQTLNTLDVHVDKTFAFGTLRLIPSIDVFNVGNFSTVLSQRTNQAASNANRVSSVIAPRVLRFGLRVQW